MSLQTSKPRNRDATRLAEEARERSRAHTVRQAQVVARKRGGDIKLPQHNGEVISTT